jgi:hypothetical protein
MIELMILEALDNIEKYQRETKTWKDKKIVRKDIRNGGLVLKERKLGESRETSRILGRTLHRKRN